LSRGLRRADNSTSFAANAISSSSLASKVLEVLGSVLLLAREMLIVTPRATCLAVIGFLGDATLTLR
jgi:hypothetical protein